MPRDDWKTIAVRSDLYDKLSSLAGDLDRPVNWTANKALEYIVEGCYDDTLNGLEFNSVAAETFGLR